MLQLSQSQPRTAPWRVFLAVLCAFLVMLVGSAQVVHMHADGTDTHTNCSLCVAAHSTVLDVQKPVVVQTFTIAARIELRRQERPVSPTTAFALFIRPPPAA